jgi:hypothetical protein
MSLGVKGLSGYYKLSGVVCFSHLPFFKVLIISNIIIINSLYRAVGRRPLTAETRVHYQARPCGFFGDQSGTRTGFPPPPPAT